MQKQSATGSSSEKNNASSSSTATFSATTIIEEDLKDDPTPLRRHVRESDKTVDVNDDEDCEPDDGIKWGEDRTRDRTGTEDSGDEALSRRSKAQKNRRRFKFASLTGRSRPSYAMRLAKMASSKFNLSGSIKETEAAE